jgi:hypothetical protein
MDWNMILFAARWAIVGLFYLILLVLLIGVYRETSLRPVQKTPAGATTYGRLRVIHSGSDPHVRSGAVFNLKTNTNLGAEPENDIVLGDQYVRTPCPAALMGQPGGWKILNSQKRHI